MSNAVNYWENRVKEKNFRNNINQLVKDLYNEFIDLKIEEIADGLLEGVEKSDPASHNVFVSSLVNALIVDSTPIIKENIERRNLSINDVLSDDSLQSWRAVVTQPVDLPKETIQAVIEQDAVKELFINVIHDAIIGFNKKFNPLFGAVSALGLDKQIKEFLVPFMDSVTGMATEFMTDNKNKGMFQEFAGKIFDMVIKEKPEKYKELPIENTSSLIAEAVAKTITDSKAQDESKKLTISFIAKVKDKFGSKTIREYMNDNNITDPTRDLTDFELDIIVKRISGSAVSTFVVKEFDNFAK